MIHDGLAHWSITLARRARSQLRISAATAETLADKRHLMAKANRLVQEFEQRLPDCDIEPQFVWGGTFAETADGLAYIGMLPSHERCYAALGYGGNGITLSMIAARLVHDLYIRRATPDAAVFSFARKCATSRAS